MSVAVPVIVTAPPGTDAPDAGEVTVTVGGVVSVEAVAATRFAWQGGRLDAHVGEQVHRRLLDVRILGGGAAIVVAVEAPGPLDGAGAEDERAGGGAVQAQVVLLGPPKLDVTSVVERRTRPAGY